MPTTPENNSMLPQPSLTCSAPRLRLIADGPDGPVCCETNHPITLIGSRRDCHLPLNDPEVSKVHCAIVHTGNAFLVCDLCSRTGIQVNGQPVRVGPLKPGDRLRMGTATARVEAVGPEAAGNNPPAEAYKCKPLNLVAQETGIVLCAQPPAAGPAVDLSTSVALIGRRSTCDVVIDTPDVSLVHALVFAFEGRPAIADLGSRSGTLVNGRRVQLDWLYDHDRLEIGGVRLAVTCDETTRAWLPTRPVVSATADALERLAGCAPKEPQVDAVADLLDVVVSDLAAARQKLDQRAAELERRQAELDAQAALIKLQLAEIEALKADLGKRQEEVQRLADEAQQRLALVMHQEQALAAAWRELERRQTAASPEPPTAEVCPAARPHLALRSLLRAAPVARPAPPAGGAAGAGLTNV